MKYDLANAEKGPIIKKKKRKKNLYQKNSFNAGRGSDEMLHRAHIAHVD